MTIMQYTKQIRAITQETIDTEDDKKFPVQEVKHAVAIMGEKKSARGRWHTKRSVPEAGRNPTPLHNINLQRVPNERNVSKEVEKSSDNTDN